MSGLWDNPMVTSALKSMSEEDIAKYKKLGEEMYGKINFEDSTIINNVCAPMAEAVAYVEEGLKSGLHPQDLDENEVCLLIEAYGEKWYEKYGYTQDEVPEPGLSLQIKKEIDECLVKKIDKIKKKKVRKLRNKGSK